jgi:uroporphyrinogen-III decarboxylase
VFQKSADWEKLTPQEKLARRLDNFVKGEDISFVNAEAGTLYKKRAERVRAALELRKPDRVPVMLTAPDYAVKRAGFTARDSMYHPEKLVQALLAFQLEFPTDLASVSISGSGRAIEHLDYKIYRWPGHGLPDTQGYQAIEGEYITADEYPQLIADPSDFFLRKYLPRTFGALEALRMLPQLPLIQEIVMVPSALAPFANPEVREALKKIMEAADFVMQDMEHIGALSSLLASSGFPDIFGGLSKAPFDAIGDTLRGTRGMILDIYRNPDMVKEACERFVPIMIQAGINSVEATGGFSVIFPLHKGADHFMSEEQYLEFYWPTLKKVLLGLNNEGILPLCFAEGTYNNRLEIISDYPKNMSLWMFDQTDMRKAKDILGKNSCIMGNVPTSIMAAGTPDRVSAYCKDLVDYCGRDGGFILTNGASIDTTNDDNIRAVLDSVK